MVKAHLKDRVTPKYRVVNGVEVKPVLYYGKPVGHGRYMAGVPKGANDMIRDATGRPIPYKHL